MNSQENLRSVTKPEGLSLELILMSVLCAGWVFWVLSLPVLPTQDGPVHLYYAHVMRALFSDQPTVYRQFYTIKHLFPPYCVYYYTLLFFGQFTTLVMADKLVACIYVVTFLFGLRYLGRAIGPSGDRMALLATIVVLNWPLGMGFVTFCESLSLAMWCIGLYLRSAGRRDTRRKVLFVVLAGLVMMTHPIPILAVCGFCLLDLALRAFSGLRARRGGHSGVERGAYLRQDTMVVLAAMLTLVYVKLFTKAHPLHQIVATEPFFQQVRDNIVMYAKGRGISPFNGMDAVALPARLCLLLVVPISLGLAALQRWRNWAAGQWTMADRWFVLAVGMLVAIPFVPHDLNSSHYFADRLLLFVWIGSLLAGSGFAVRAWGGRLAVILFALAGNFFIFRAAEVYVRPAANEIALIEKEPVTHEGQVGLLIDSDWNVEQIKFGPLFNSYGWAAVNYFRHNNAVLYNTPWLDLTNIPLGAQWTLPTGTISPETLEDPNGMRTELLSDLRERDDVLSSVNFVFVNRARARGIDANPLASGQPEDVFWSQAPDLASWYTVWDVKQPPSN